MGKDSGFPLTPAGMTEGGLGTHSGLLTISAHLCRLAFEGQILGCARCGRGEEKRLLRRAGET